jgi:hypothetical protein
LSRFYFGMYRSTEPDVLRSLTVFVPFFRAVQLPLGVERALCGAGMYVARLEVLQ